MMIFGYLVKFVFGDYSHSVLKFQQWHTAVQFNISTSDWMDLASNKPVT